MVTLTIQVPDSLAKKSVLYRIAFLKYWPLDWMSYRQFPMKSIVIFWNFLSVALPLKRL